MKKSGLAWALVTAAVLAAQPARAGDHSWGSSTYSSRNDSRSDNNRNDSNRSDSRSNSRNESRNSSQRDQDDAREALRRGKVMPLTAILEIAFRRERGTVLEVELETDDGALNYHIELLTERGRKVDMWLNARTGEILKVRYS